MIKESTHQEEIIIKNTHVPRRPFILFLNRDSGLAFYVYHDKIVYLSYHLRGSFGPEFRVNVLSLLHSYITRSMFEVTQITEETSQNDVISIYLKICIYISYLYENVCQYPIMVSRSSFYLEQRSQLQSLPNSTTGLFMKGPI